MRLLFILFVHLVVSDSATVDYFSGRLRGIRSDSYEDQPEVTPRFFLGGTNLSR